MQQVGGRNQEYLHVVSFHSMKDIIIESLHFPWNKFAETDLGAFFGIHIMCSNFKLQKFSTRCSLQSSFDPKRWDELFVSKSKGFSKTATQHTDFSTRQWRHQIQLTKTCDAQPHMTVYLFCVLSPLQIADLFFHSYVLNFNIVNSLIHFLFNCSSFWVSIEVFIFRK